MTYPTRNLVYGLCFMATIMVGGVLGYRIAGWDWSDSVYMVVISIFTVASLSNRFLTRLRMEHASRILFPELI